MDWFGPNDPLKDLHFLGSKNLPKSLRIPKKTQKSLRIPKNLPKSLRIQKKIQGIKNNFVPSLSSPKDGIIARANSHPKGKAAVIGGGLLGLEAAKALVDLGMEPWMVFLSRVFFCIGNFEGTQKTPQEMPGLIQCLLIIFE